MTMLHLVRHGRSRPDPTTPAADWPLHPAAGAGIERLRSSGALPTAARWFASPEPKALATARALTTAAVGVVDGLREAQRGPEWFDDETFKSVVRRSLLEPQIAAHSGWEPASQAQARVAGAVERIAASCPGDALVLVGHGGAWTLLVAALTGQPPDLEAWLSMRMPDHCAIDREDRLVTSAWGAWQTSQDVAHRWEDGRR
jgi:broad specificity phosphatase PhoE